MTTLTARFTQSPNENRRYSIDYTLDLAVGETVSSVVSNIFPAQNTPASPALAINNTAISPDKTQVVFFCSGGSPNAYYEVQFLATTSIGQVYENVVGFNIRADV